ncbi:hypothetical protein BSL78_27354 [Apostichopus japonicus]|uniref:Uncharacterized protein n=1 Tax=Stichopus japonicus TaxID=307972 RepID=A0A2G8JJ88_STIJA|nr:hypothetical protein BSL78_27354 [Apostichopus japonicus]
MIHGKPPRQRKKRRTATQTGGDVDGSDVSDDEWHRYINRQRSSARTSAPAEQYVSDGAPDQLQNGPTQTPAAVDVSQSPVNQTPQTPEQPTRQVEPPVEIPQEQVPQERVPEEQGRPSRNRRPPDFLNYGQPGAPTWVQSTQCPYSSYLPPPNLGQPYPQTQTRPWFQPYPPMYDYRLQTPVFYPQFQQHTPDWTMYRPTNVERS